MGQETPRKSGFQTSRHAGWENRGDEGRETVLGGVRATHQVLIDDAVARGEEGQDVRDEVPLLGLQGLPVLQVLGEVHLAPGSQGSGTQGSQPQELPTFLPPSGPTPLAGTGVPCHLEHGPAGAWVLAPTGKSQVRPHRLPGLCVPDPATSSAVQKEASAFLYICQMSWYSMGKTTKRRGFSRSSGSSCAPGAGPWAFCRGERNDGPGRGGPQEIASPPTPRGRCKVGNFGRGARSARGAPRGRWEREREGNSAEGGGSLGGKGGNNEGASGPGAGPAPPGAPYRPPGPAHRLGRLLEDPPRGLAGQHAGAAEARGLRGDAR